jgi:GT2 family glycosyltransferase
MSVISTDTNTATRFPRIQVQSIIYNLGLDHLEKALEYLDNAVLQAKRQGAVGSVEVAYGDCSPIPVLDDRNLAHLRCRCPEIDKVSYTFFSANLGSAAGHNRLASSASADFIMVLNPDVLAAPNLFGELLDALGRSGVGLAEARQLPVEHPKDFDDLTGETGWASTACVLVPAKLYHELQGFDADTFFLYCDDVDFSWRARMLGYKIIHQSSAVVYHDKRLDAFTTTRDLMRPADGSPPQPRSTFQPRPDCF